MARRKSTSRKLEIHRLQISGLNNADEYGDFLRRCWEDYAEREDAIYEHGAKSHCLDNIRKRRGRYFLTFFSFTTGYRPDVLNTSNFEIKENPLSPDETAVDWTHVLGESHGGKFVFGIEKTQPGIWPSAIEAYLQWMIDNSEFASGEEDDADPFTVSVEPKPDASFVQRINSLSRVTKASLRVVRPNPGWADLEDEIAEESEKSDSHKTDLTMRARRGASLKKTSGLLKRIKDLFNAHDLGYAEIEGEKGNGKRDRFSTASMGAHTRERLPVDSNGKVDEEALWRSLEDAVTRFR